jgi:hypothetical protein
MGARSSAIQGRRSVPYEEKIEPWASQGWKVKIYDDEGPEEPHASVTRRTMGPWRVSLRTGRLLDRKPDPRDLPKGLLEGIEARLDGLGHEWDALHPKNPVGSKEDRS